MDRRADLLAALGGGTVAHCSCWFPVDQFGLGNGEGDVDPGGLSLERRAGFLEEANVGSV